MSMSVPPEKRLTFAQYMVCLYAYHILAKGRAMDKKKIQKLKRRRETLGKTLVGLGPLMRGSVVELATTCGNPNCRCTRGHKHKKLFYSMSRKGKTTLVYLGKSRAPLARQYSDNYKRLLEIVEEMTTINMQLLRGNGTGKTR